MSVPKEENELFDGYRRGKVASWKLSGARADPATGGGWVSERPAASRRARTHRRCPAPALPDHSGFLTLFATA